MLGVILWIFILAPCLIGHYVWLSGGVTVIGEEPFITLSLVIGVLAGFFAVWGGPHLRDCLTITVRGFLGLDMLEVERKL